MFKVRTRLVAFIGDEEKYPCHMQHMVGDEIIFDGERYIGRLCPDVWPLLTPKVTALHQAGPRYIEPFYYYPFWYAPPSVKDASRKKYDGLGFAPVLKTHKEAAYHMANLAPPRAYEWPPCHERIVGKGVSVVCPDPRTAAVFALEAFDLSDKGFDVPFFRRQMTILDRVLKKQGVARERILDEFSREEREAIYPPLVAEMLIPLMEELEIIGYIQMKEGEAFVTEKGEARLKEFTVSLTAEEKHALKV
jgi:uncharacterized repeat protein (TIGR04076 family)